MPFLQFAILETALGSRVIIGVCLLENVALG